MTADKQPFVCIDERGCWLSQMSLELSTAACEAGADAILDTADQVALPPPPPRGCVEGDCDAGTGKYVYPSGATYEGSWWSGMRHGTGKYVKDDGTVIEGTFKYGYPQKPEEQAKEPAGEKEDL